MPVEIKVNLADMIGGIVWTGKPMSDIWIGFVKDEEIMKYLIKDDSKKRQYMQLVKKLEQDAYEFRNAYSNNFTFNNSPNNGIDKEARAKELENEISNIVKELGQYILNFNDDRLTAYCIALVREYEVLQKKNPSELNLIPEKTKKCLDDFIKKYNGQNLAFERFDPQKNEYDLKVISTIGCEKKRYSVDNYEKLKLILMKIYDIDEMDENQFDECLYKIAGYITTTSIPLFQKSPDIGSPSIVCFMKNFLLKCGYSAQEIENMKPNDFINQFNELYLNLKVEQHAQIMADMIKSQIKYIDIEKMLLLICSNSLGALENIGGIKSSKNDESAVENTKIEPADNTESAQIQESNDENIMQNEEKSFEQSMKECGLLTERIDEKGFFDLMKEIKKINEVILSSGELRENLKVEDKNIAVLATVKDIKSKMKNFCGDVYLNEQITEKLIGMALYYGLYDWNDELILALPLAPEIIRILCVLDERNLLKLHKLNLITNEDIKECFLIIKSDDFGKFRSSLPNDDSNNDKISKSVHFLQRLLINELIDKEDIKEYVQEGLISLDELCEVSNGEENSNQSKIINDFWGKENLLIEYKNYIESYIAMLKGDSNKEQVNELRKRKDIFLNMFKKINGYDKLAEEEKDVIGANLLEEYCVNMDVDDEEILKGTLRVLYEDGLISLKNINEFGSDYLIPMMDSLSLADCEKLRSSMNFDDVIKLLYKIFEVKSFSDEQKFIIIMNMLTQDTEEDRAAIDMFKEQLYTNNDEKISKKNSAIHDEKIANVETTEEKNEEKSSSKYVYSDIVKWKFYKSLDPNVRVTRYANGYIEFASSKFEKRIIEKYYEKDNSLAYGTATYILPEDLYRVNQGDLITVNKNANILESSVLRDITPKKDRVIHRTHSKDRTWMDEIIKYFDIDFSGDSRYSQEELKTLKVAIDKYKNVYEKI